jgi:hypothetical protein
LAQSTKSRIVGGVPGGWPITESRAFKTWFAGSSVTDPHGMPLRMYHGTYTTFDEFDQSNFIHLFTPDPSMAARYARDSCWFASMDCKPSSPRIMPVYLKVCKPFDPRAVSCARLMKKWGLGSPADYDFGEWVYLEDLEVGAKIRALGYDGIWMRLRLADYDALAVFDPKQIKSAIGNNGAFDPTSASIIG